MNTKDVLDIVVIPLVLAGLALLWPVILERSRRRIFQRLVIRELEEVGPYPVDKLNPVGWWEHQTKRFVHQKIFEEVTGNRDFLLSLDPDLVYFVSQLWQAKQERNPRQWLHFLSMIVDYGYDPHGRIKCARDQWCHLLHEFKVSGDPNCQ